MWGRSPGWAHLGNVPVPLSVNRNSDIQLESEAVWRVPGGLIGGDAEGRALPKVLTGTSALWQDSLRVSDFWRGGSELPGRMFSVQ